MALVNLEIYNSIPNITVANNTFVSSHNGGSLWKKITLPEGSYEISQINAAIRRQLEVNGDWNSDDKSHYITVGANPSIRFVLSYTFQILATTWTCLRQP